MGFFQPQNPGIGGLDELTSTEETFVQTGAAGVILLAETTAPSATVGFGKLYVKSSDSLLYFKDASGTETAVLSSAGANTALSNLASVAINTSLVSDLTNTDNLGSASILWATIFVTNVGATGTRVTQGWFTDVESTNMFTVGGTSLSDTFVNVAGDTMSGDLLIYDAVNDANPQVRIGATDAEELHIQAVYDMGAQTLDYVQFETDVASATADKGEYRFNVDGSLSATIDDGGIEIKASGSLSFGAVDILTDSTGTTTLNNIDVLDATTEATIEAAIDTLANLTSIQGLTVTLADAGANAIFGWDDTASAYENLTQAEVLAVIGDAAADGATKGVSAFTAADFDAASGVISIDYTNGQKASTTQAGFATELATTTETNTGTDTTRVVTPDGLSSAVKSIMLTAAGGAPLTTAGCSEPTKVEAATNDINYWVLDFDTTTEEHAFWAFPMPENWDAGTVTAQFYWTNASGLATETVDWGIAGGSWGNDDAIDAALGTEVTTTDTFLAQGDIHISAKSTAVTIANAAAGEWVNIVVARKVATDNLTGDARLIAVKLTYTIDQYSDEI